MLKGLIILSILISVVTSSSVETVRYDHHSLYRLVPTEGQMKTLQVFQNNHRDYDFWNEPQINRDFVSVLVRPEQKIEFNQFLLRYGIQFEITIPNVQGIIESQARINRKTSKQLSWDAYYTLEEINAWLYSLQAEYPSIVSIVAGGLSYEGHNITGVKLSYGPGRRAIIIEGGIHAREWIAPATATYIINELLTSADVTTRQAAQDFDWYIFPVLNPDGFKFSHERNRLWRKNRRQIALFVYGVDLNRNFDNNWMVAGASTIASSEAYAGPAAFSEPESKSYSDFLTSIGKNIDVYFSFHSYGQLLMLPFGNTTTHLSNYEEAITVGRKGLEALSSKYGTKYRIGNIAETIYLATGGSTDWVKEALDVPLVYCYELRDQGRNGFLLPADQIRPTAEETMASVVEIVDAAIKLGYI